ncbi:MAG: transporter [Halioglobus sp.]
MNKPSLLCRLLASLLLPLASTAGYTAEGGYSNYIPGTYGDFAMAVEPPDKLTLRNDVYYYEANDKESFRAGRVEVEADLTFLVNLTTLLYKPDVQIAGAQYAFGTLIPVAKNEIDSTLNVDLMASGPTYSDTAEASGLGDIVLVPWVLYWNEKNLHTTFSQYIVAPTGDYDKTNSINAGLNYWSFDSNIAVTYLNPTSGWEFSGNLGYIYNTENSATDYQSGEEIHVDFAINRYLSESLALGIHGFHQKQVTGDSGDGAVLGDFKAEVSGAGPALLWSTQLADRPVSLIAKWLHDFDADRRIEGDHFIVSFALGFN